MIFEDSRYSNTPLLLGEGISTFARRDMPKFNLNNCPIHMVVQGETLDTLAYAYYNNSALWWAIFDANQDIIKDYFSIEPGTRLKIPSIEEIREVTTYE